MLMKWFKQVRHCWLSKPTVRVSYSLPDSKVFPKYYNSKTFFKDINWTDWNAVVDGFEQRYVGWYFDKMHGGDSSSADILVQHLDPIRQHVLPISKHTCDASKGHKPKRRAEKSARRRRQQRKIYPRGGTISLTRMWADTSAGSK
jgi:hypothetical protein